MIHESILQMPFGTAQIYRQLPAALQRDADVREAAKQKPKLFRAQVAQDYPEALVETRTRLSLNLDNSVYLMWEEFMKLVRQVNDDPGMTYEAALELELLGPRLEMLRLEANARNRET